MILLKNIMGFFLVLLFFIVTLLFSFSILVMGSLSYIMPFLTWRKAMMRGALKMLVFWYSASGHIMRLPTNHEWEIRGDAKELDHQSWYLLIANHQTWLDILVIGLVFNRKTAPIKFFMKRELLWSLPIVGWASFSIGFPFLKRHSLKEIRKNPQLRNVDIETTKKACEKFKYFPTTAVNFVEGTRFTKEKQKFSPYRSVLKPKATGATLIINALRKELSGVLNVTIHYSKPVTFWTYLRGDPCKISVCYELLPLPEEVTMAYDDDSGLDRLMRKACQKWLNGLWEQKDRLLRQLDQNV